MENVSNIIEQMVKELDDDNKNLSVESFFSKHSLNDQLFKALDRDLQEQDRLHRKDDQEAKNKLKFGEFFFEISKDRPSELNLAINCFSKSILLAKDDSILFEAYYQRAKAFLIKKSYFNSFYDSRHYLENVQNGDLQRMKEISSCYIECCINIIEENMRKINKPQINENQKIKLLKQANEFLDRARVELAIQLLCFDSRQFLNEIKDLDRSIEPSPMTKFQYYHYKHSNVYDVLSNQNSVKDDNHSIGSEILFERPLSFLTIKAIRYCGFCANLIAYKFIPCSGCDEIIYCNWFCRRLSEEFGGHLTVCRYNFRVAQILGVQSYLIYTEAAKIRKIHYNQQTISYGNDKDNETNQNLIKVQALALTHIIKQKLFAGNLKINLAYYQNIFEELNNLYRSPFLKQRIPNSSTQKSDIIGHGLIEHIIEHSPNTGNIGRYLKQGKIIYKTLEPIKKDETKLRLKL